MTSLYTVHDFPFSTLMFFPVYLLNLYLPPSTHRRHKNAATICGETPTHPLVQTACSLPTFHGTGPTQETVIGLLFLALVNVFGCCVGM